MVAQTVFEKTSRGRSRAGLISRSPTIRERRRCSKEKMVWFFARTGGDAWRHTVGELPPRLWVHALVERGCTIFPHSLERCSAVCARYGAVAWLELEDSSEECPHKRKICDEERCATFASAETVNTCPSSQMVTQDLLPECPLASK